jgi:hypothetical protein
MKCSLGRCLGFVLHFLRSLAGLVSAFVDGLLCPLLRFVSCFFRSSAGSLPCLFNVAFCALIRWGALRSALSHRQACKNPAHDDDTHHPGDISHKIFLSSQRRASSGEQVDKQHNHGDHQQQMDQTSSDVKAESQKPHNEQNYKNGPEH